MADQASVTVPGGPTDAVRASMAAGSAEALVEAAKRIPRRHWLDVLDDDAFGGQMLRSEAEFDRTGHFPLEALVAARLDGRPERWAEVARHVAAGRLHHLTTPRPRRSTKWTRPVQGGLPD